MLDFLIWLLYGVMFAGATLFVLNEWRRWRKPYLFKGDTGPMGVVGAPGVCTCTCCTGELSGTYYEGKSSLAGPMSKESLYNLPEIPEDK